MSAGLAVMLILACQGTKPWEPPVDDFRPMLRLRFGEEYSKGFTFDATRIDGRREIDGKDAGFIGIDAGMESAGRYFSFAGLEAGFATDVSILTASFGAGGSLNLELSRSLPSFRLSPYAAMTYGLLDVDAPGFGAFRPGIGGRAGLDIEVPVAGSFRIGIFGEGRYVRYRYKEDVIEGDRVAGGVGFVGGLSAVMTF